MTRAMKKRINQPEYYLDEDVNMRATVDAVLKKNRYADNLAAIQSETAKRTDDVLI